MQLQKSDPIFKMVVNVMRPAFNCEPKYGVIMLIRDDLGFPLQLRGSSGIQIGPACGGGGTGSRVNGNLWEEGPVSL